jgi:hypothetical protein
MTERLAERRRNKRIDVALPVILENATAVTRDASASGVFFWKRGTFMYGESIRFSIERITESGKILQKCRGVVIRTEPLGNEVGVAARITESTTEPVPSRLEGADLLTSAREQPPRLIQPRDDALASAIETVDRRSPPPREKAIEAREPPPDITQHRDDALASAIETVDRWSWLLRKKALDACEELQGQEVLEWDFPSIADATTPHSRRVTVCSVSVVDLGPNEARVPRHNGIPVGSDRHLNLLHSEGGIEARKPTGGAGFGEEGGFVNRRNPHDGYSVRIELETCVANASQGARIRGKRPLPKIVVRTTSVRADSHHQELDKNGYEQASYSDPTEAFEAFLALAVESAILFNLDSLES